MKLPNGKTAYIFDNGEETADRFTIVDINTNVYGCSTMPFHPLGIGMYCFTETDEYERWCRDKGKKMLKSIIKDTLRDILKNYRKNDLFGEMGKEIRKFESLPEDVQKYVLQVTE